MHNRLPEHILSDRDVFQIPEPDVEALRHARDLREADGDATKCGGPGCPRGESQYGVGVKQGAEHSSSLGHFLEIVQ